MSIVEQIEQCFTKANGAVISRADWDEVKKLIPAETIKRLNTPDPDPVYTTHQKCLECGRWVLSSELCQTPDCCALCPECFGKAWAAEQAQPPEQEESSD